MIQIEYYPGSFTEKDISQGPLVMNLAFFISHTNLTPCATYGHHPIGVTLNQDTPTILMTQVEIGRDRILPQELHSKRHISRPPSHKFSFFDV